MCCLTTHSIICPLVFYSYIKRCFVLFSRIVIVQTSFLVYKLQKKHRVVSTCIAWVILYKRFFKFPKSKIFGLFYNSLFSSFFSFPKLKKLNISAIKKAIILFFAVNLPMVYIYKSCKRITWRTSGTSPRWSLTKKIRVTQNFIKDKMTRRVNILWRIFEKIAKNLKMKSQERKTSFLVNLSENFPKIWALLLQFCSFLKNAPDYIYPSGHFVLYEIFCCSNF